MTNKSKLLEVLESITDEDINKALIEVKKEEEKILNIFLWKIISTLELTDDNEKTIEVKIEENWLFFSDNINKILEKVNKKWFDILNISDFEVIKNCESKQRGFLYTQLMDLTLKLKKIKN